MSSSFGDREKEDDVEATEETRLLKVDDKEDERDINDDLAAALQMSTSPVVEDNSSQKWLSLLCGYWNPIANLKEIFIRDRATELYSLDGVRALAYLWVVNIHITEGMGICYSDFSSYVNGGVGFARLFDSSSGQGVTVFFVLSGFLIPFVFTIISNKNKDGQWLSVKSLITFLVRRFFRVAPTLYFCVIFALLYGWFWPTDSDVYAVFHEPCVDNWWFNFLFIGNYQESFDHETCYSSTWSVSAEFQLYLLCIPFMYCYIYNKYLGMVMAILWMVGTWVLRVWLIYQYGYSMRLIYFPSICRADAYAMGMFTYMLWQNYFKVRKEENCKVEDIKTTLGSSLIRYFLIIISIGFIAFGVDDVWNGDLKVWSETTWKVIFEGTSVPWNGTSYAFAVVGLGTAGLIYIALDKSMIMQPINWFLSSYFFFPIASLSYSAYLTSQFVFFTWGQVILDYNGEEVDCNITDYWPYGWIYLKMVLTNLSVALLFALIVERPCMKMGKDIKFDCIDQCFLFCCLKKNSDVDRIISAA